MADYIIITDSGCDLDAQMLAQLELHYVPLKVNYPDRSLEIYPDGRGMTVEAFYQTMRDGAAPKTSATTTEQWLEEAKPALKAGKDVIMVPFSSGLSSTYQSAVIAAEELRGQFPTRTIRVCDIRCASLGQGLLLYHAANLRKNGATVEETADWLDQNALHLCHWFTVESLTYLRRGGRISAATALAGTVLGIKPVMHVDDEGHLINVDKKRGRRASLEALANRLVETAIEPEKQTIFISHGDCIEDAKLLEQMVRAKTPIGGCYINHVGPVIGAHSGPGTIALFFLGSKR